MPAGVFERIECALGDLTREPVDAIVNAANEGLRGGGGVDGAIHRAAGPGLLRECLERHSDGCPTGQARLTGGHNLAARFVIHTVGPIYRDGRCGEPGLLASCYRESIALAAEHDLRTLSFPAISTGVFGYPWPEAASIAIESTASALAAHRQIERVRMVLFSEELCQVFASTLRRFTDA